MTPNLGSKHVTLLWLLSTPGYEELWELVSDSTGDEELVSASTIDFLLYIIQNSNFMYKSQKSSWRKTSYTMSFYLKRNVWRVIYVVRIHFILRHKKKNYVSCLTGNWTFFTEFVLLWISGLSNPLSTLFDAGTNNQELKLSFTHLVLRWLRY